MRYWWVNQNQTFSHEVGGGYLWSPKRTTRGNRNQFYENMTLVEPGDIILSFADTHIKAIGIATGRAISSEKPQVFGLKGDYWNTDGWKVPVEFSRVENPLKPKDHMGLLAPLLPEKYSPLTKEGKGLQGVYLAELPHDMGSLLLGLLGNPDISMPVIRLEDLSFSQEEHDLIADDDLRETEKVTLVMARRGQGLFRSRVQAIESRCRVTGISAKELLVASHIKPWKQSDNRERLDGNNGLFLSPHVDRLFDSGLISFTRNGRMLVSSALDPDVLSKWHIDPRAKYGTFNQDQGYFLDYHQSEKFQSS